MQGHHHEYDSGANINIRCQAIEKLGKWWPRLVHCQCKTFLIEFSMHEMWINDIMSLLDAAPSSCSEVSKSFWTAIQSFSSHWHSASLPGPTLCSSCHKKNSRTYLARKNRPLHVAKNGRVGWKMTAPYWTNPWEICSTNVALEISDIHSMHLLSRKPLYLLLTKN
jgi:hypothetical protein